MGSDLARLSYDRTRGYRSVIVQQGRVTLEADANEAAKLASEALRHETIDIVGPAGTPDQGYAVSAGSGGPTDIVCGAGTMYLGGWRLHQDAPVHLNKQPDWLNLAPGQPDWKNLPATTQARGNLLIALLATEQSVSAVEDNALREVALGGPDTAARSRLMQHFLAIPVVAATRAEAAKELVADLGFTDDAGREDLRGDLWGKAAGEFLPAADAGRSMLADRGRRVSGRRQPARAGDDRQL